MPSWPSRWAQVVGALFAIAACLVAYQGVGLLEDYALNGAGFYAVFVALVPTGFQEEKPPVHLVGECAPELLLGDSSPSRCGSSG